MTRFGLGETVGEAFIRIHASGSNLPNEIKREFERANPAIQSEASKSGRDTGHAWSSSFHDELRDPETGIGNLSREVGAQRRQVQRWRDVGAFLASEEAEARRKALIKSLGPQNRELADRIFKNLSAEFQRHGDIPLFRAGFNEGLFREIDKGLKQIQADEEKFAAKQKADADAARRATEQQNRLNLAAARHAAADADRRIKDQERAFREQKRLAEAARRDQDRAARASERDGKSVIRDLERAVAVRRQLFARTDSGFAVRDFERLRSVVEGMSRDFDGMRGNTFRSNQQVVLMRRRLAELRDETQRVERGFALVDRRVVGGVRDVGSMERGLRRVEERVKRVRIGRLFGEGSRNDFFNILGKIVGKLGEAVVLAGPRMARSFASWGSALRQSGNPLKFLEGSLVRGLAKLATSAGGAFIALAALQTVAGPLAAALSELSGVVVALAGSIGIGLVGAVAAVLPLLGVFAAGIAVFALAFAGLRKFSKEQKALLKEKLTPVINDYHRLRDVATKGLFSDLPKSVPLLHRFMEQSAIPIVRTASRTMAKSITGFLGVLSGPVAQRNLDTLRRLIPDAGRRMGKILGNVFNIIGGFMRAATPLARRFLASLEQSTQRISRLVNSARGQNHLRKWLNDAYTSARKVYGFFRALGIVIFDLLNLGKPTGDNIFDSWTKSLQDFDHWLKSSSGIKTVTGWFDRSQGMLSHLGGALKGIGHLFATLAAGGGGSLNTILDVIGKIANLIADLLPSVQKPLKDFWDQVGRVLESAERALKPLKKVLEDLLPLVGTLFSAATKVAADILVTAFDALHDVLQFVSDHQNVFGPITKELLLFWAAWKGYTILTTVTGALRTMFVAIGVTSIRTFFATLATGVTSGFTTLVATLRTGTRQVQTQGQKLSAAITGIGIALAGQAVASQVGGAGGKAIAIGTGALGGGIIGASIGGPPGAAIGAGIGAVASAIAAFWQDSTEAAQQGAAAQVAALQAVETEAGLLATALQQDANKIGRISRLTISAALAIPTKGRPVSPLEEARQFGISPQQLVAATVSPSARRAVRANLNVMLSDVDDQLSRHQANVDRLLAKQNLGAQGLGPFTKAQQDQLTAEQKLVGTLKDRKTALDDVLGRLGLEAAAERRAIRQADIQALGAGKLSLATRDLATQTGVYRHVLQGSSVDAEINRKFIQDHIHAIDTDAAKNVKNASAARAAARAIVNRTAQFRREAVQMGFNGTLLDGLITKFGHIPRSILTKLKADDTDASHKVAIMLFKKGLISKQWLIRIIGKDEASAVIDKVQHKRDALKDKTIFITAKGIIDPALNPKHLGGGGVGGGGLSGGAMGGLFAFPQVKLIGEAGPEALVPLARPLSQVDPAVRWLSAYAQGLSTQTTGPTRTQGILQQRIVNVQPGAIMVTTPTTDPVAVAAETLNRMVARGGYG